MKYKQGSSLEEIYKRLAELLLGTLKDDWELGKMWFRYFACDASGVKFYAVDKSGSEKYVRPGIDVSSEAMDCFELISERNADDSSENWVSAVLTVNRRREVNIEFEYGDYYDPVADRKPRPMT